MTTLLCLLAHPDDESFGAAATLARAAHEGVRVVVVTATPGDQGHWPQEARDAGLPLAEIREAELRKACETLGVARLELLGFGDGTLASLPEEQIEAAFLPILEAERPSTILTFGPRGITGHADHITIGKLATRAFYRMEQRGITTQLFYLALEEADAIAMQLRGIEAQPNTQVPIGDFLEVKLAALACHASQPDARQQMERFAADPPAVEVFYRAFPSRELTERIERLW